MLWSGEGRGMLWSGEGFVLRNGEGERKEGGREGGREGEEEREGEREV